MKPELEKLRAEVANCKQCELCQGRKQAVFGMGDENAELFIIGEGPGYHEDMQGLPFVGPSGELLDKILGVCGFTRQQHVFIGNIIKCRPLGNRTPTPTERQTCFRWLEKQIEIINPKIIVILGSTALQGLIHPEMRISRERGNWLKYKHYEIMATYHPAALLRDASLKRPTWEDFKKIVKRYRELVDPKHYSAHC